jgi:hypothetical protein
MAWYMWIVIAPFTAIGVAVVGITAWCCWPRCEKERAEHPYWCRQRAGQCDMHD